MSGMNGQLGRMPFKMQETEALGPYPHGVFFPRASRVNPAACGSGEGAESARRLRSQPAGGGSFFQKIRNRVPKLAFGCILSEYAELGIYRLESLINSLKIAYWLSNLQVRGRKRLPKEF